MSLFAIILRTKRMDVIVRTLDANYQKQYEVWHCDLLSC